MNVKARSSKAEARTQAQRERILCAAQQCFIEFGFHAAGMAKIAETAGMTEALSPGIARSMRTTSGRSLSACSTASRPSPASPTTVTPSSDPSTMASPSR